MRQVGPISQNTLAFSLALTAISAVKKQGKGIGDFSSLCCGKNVTGCKEVSAAEMTRTLAAKL